MKSGHSLGATVSCKFESSKKLKKTQEIIIQGLQLYNIVSQETEFNLADHAGHYRLLEGQIG